MSHEYDLQAARIESVLTAHKVPARVWQATITPRFVRFDVTTALGTRPNKVSNLAEELAFSLGARMTRIYRDGGVLHVEVPRETSRAVALARLCNELEAVPPYCGVLGVDDGGMPLLMRIDSPDVAHVLIAGTTGSGKTGVIRTLLLSLAMHNHPGQLQLVLLDPKGRGLAPLARLPHLWHGHAIAQDARAAGDALQALVEEMLQRDASRRSLPRIVIGIDELADLLMEGGKPVADALTRLTQRARSRHPYPGSHPEAGRNPDGWVGQSQLPRAAGGQRGEPGRCQGGCRHRRHRRRTAVGPRGLPVGQQRADHPFPGSLREHGRDGCHCGTHPHGEPPQALLAPG